MSPQGPEPPSGEQHHLRHGDQEVVVTEVGATMREYRVGGRAVLDGFSAADLCSGGRGQHLIPWPNRVGDGRYTFEGQAHQLPITEVPRNNAIHGLVRWASWTAALRSESELTMRHRLRAQTGYPFSLDLSITYALDEDGLTVTTAATNVGASAAPYGSGAHPYLTAATATVDACRLQIAAETRLLSDDKQLPVGRARVEGGDDDFRELRPIGQTRLDTAFGELRRDDDGRARILLESPAGDRVALWMDGAYLWVMVFTGDTLDSPQERRRGIAIEPMTCPPNAFQSGEDLIVLPPGGGTSGQWGIDISGFRG